MLYVFCGRTSDNRLIDLSRSIESLDVHRGLQWKAFTVQPIMPRENCGAIAIDDQNILLFGGTNENGCMSDIYLLNTTSKRIVYGSRNSGAKIE